MTLRSLIDSWNHFFFRPISPISLGLFRIAFGSVLLLNELILIPDLLTWFGENGVLPLSLANSLLEGIRLNLFQSLPPTDLSVQIFFGFLILSTLCLCFGLFTRVASVLVYVGIVSLHHRNIFILNSGDTLLRTLSFILMFAPAGKALSLDRWIQLKRGNPDPHKILIEPWAQRLLQIQLVLLYWAAFSWKVRGISWIEGTAVFYTLQLDEFKRFPLPALARTLLLSKIASWFTLIAEGSLGLLIWIKELRYYVLGMGVFLHLALDYAMNVPIFQWVCLTVYILFIDGRDWTRLYDGVKGISRTAIAVPRFSLRFRAHSKR